MKRFFVFITILLVLAELTIINSLAGEQKTSTGWYWPAGSGDTGGHREWLGVYDELLFSMGLEFQGDLDKGIISEDLRGEFKNSGISLSDNATVSTEEENSMWRITDNNQTYIIKKKAGKLNVYKRKYHLAQDFERDAGLSVYALGDGEVVIARTDVSGYGPNGTAGGALVARFQTSDGSYFLALYGHLDKLHSTGPVDAGDILGECNNYNPPHLHFGIHPGYDLPENPCQGYTTDENNTYGWVDPIDFLLNHNPLLMPTPIYVDDDLKDHPDADFTRIQDAVNAAISGNTILVYPGTYTENVDANKDHLTIKSESGVEVTIVQAANPNDYVFEVTADYVNISGFTVKGSIGTGKAGIYLGSNSDHCNISNNIALYNRWGFLLHSNNNTLMNNVANSNNESGIFLNPSSNNTLMNNVSSSNIGSGIYLDWSSNNNTLTSNIAVSNGSWGIYLKHSSNNMLTNNIVSNHSSGIYLNWSSDNNIFTNNICEDNSYGIKLSSSNSNLIYLNNFINNRRNVYSQSSTNILNSASKIIYTYNDKTYTNYLGNYWSDYTGSDANGDGIGDAPYSINSEQDTYPLMGPFKNYGIVESQPQSIKFTQGDYVQTTENLHLRTDPQIDDNIITTLPLGSIGQVVDDENNGVFIDGYYWWHVQFGDNNGWCAENWLEKTEPPTKPEVGGLIKRLGIGEVHSVDWSPDGNFIAVGTSSGVHILDSQMLEILKSMAEHKHSVESVAFSPDSSLLASGSRDNTIKLWSVSDGKCIATLNHGDCVNSVAFSPDSSLLASGGWDHTIKLWRVLDFECTATLEGHLYSVESVTFSPDGSLLASGSRDNTIKLWSISSGKCIATLEGHEDNIHSVAFNPDGSLLASGGGDKTIRLWRVSDGGCVATLEGHKDRVYSVAFSPDGFLIASGSRDNTIKLWRVSDSKCIATLEEHEGYVTSVAFSPDSSQLISGSMDNTIGLWRIGPPKEEEEKKEYNPQVSIPPYAPFLGFGNKGTVLTFVIKVENRGTKKDTIDLTASSQPEGLAISLSKNSVTLPPSGSELVYISATVEDIKYEMNITAASRSDKSQKSSLAIATAPEEHHLYFHLGFSNSDVKEHTLKFNAPDVKLSKESLELMPGRGGSIEFIFDPKTNRRKFDIEISDETTGESIKIPIEIDPNCKIVATDFDIAKDGYNFPNWGVITIPKFDKEILGYCYGMAETSLLYFNFRNGLLPAEEPPNPELYKNTYDLPKEIAKERIRTHHFLSMVLGFFDQLGISINQYDEYEKLKSSLANDKPMILTMRFGFLSIKAHSVVAYRIIEMGEEAYVLVYDNREPYSKDELRVSFPYLKYNSSTGELSYSDHELGEFKNFIVSEPKRITDWLREFELIIVACPVDVTIKDKHGRRVSTDGTNEIPGANMLITSKEKAFYLPADMKYSVELDAYDSGKFNFTRVSPIGNDISVTKIEDVSITKETKAFVEVKPEVVDYTMKIDYNGDGAIDEEKDSEIAEEIKTMEEHPWDINSDGIVDIFDLAVVEQHFGASPPTDSRSDVNKDGRVDISDLVLVASHFGEKTVPH